MITQALEVVAEKSMAKGLVACAIASVFFGSMFVPIRRYNAGDGIYVQWLMSVAIVIFSFFTWLWAGLPQFYPLAMLGGMLWCIGNAMAVPIIRRMGMAMGMLIWNTTNCLAGWAGGNFGLFGMTARPASNPLLNYVGLLFVIVGGVLFSQVKGNASEAPERKEIALESINVDEKRQLSEDDNNEVPEPKVKESVSGSKDRIIGISLALLSGAFYGNNFVPVIYIQDNYVGASPRGTPYVFSHSMGIFLTATALFIGYSVFKKNKPVINNQITLPALCAGLIWIVAQTSFFVANENLSQTVSFPIITMIPGCVAAAWSIVVFKEIQKHAMVQETMFIGFAAVVISSAFSGSTFVPIKLFDANKGMFPQFMIGLGIFVVGVVIFIAEGFPPIYPVAVLGGISWATGNAFSIPVMNALGMALGILIWNTTGAITGWSVSRFGLFGVKPTPLSSIWLNYCGLLLLILGGAAYIFVKSIPYQGKAYHAKEPVILSFQNNESGKNPSSSQTTNISEKEKMEVSSIRTKILGIFGAVISGLLFGVLSTPITYIKDHREDFGNPPDREMHFVFSQFLGFFITSTVIFIGYSIWRKNEPIVDPPTVLPAFLTGLMSGCNLTFFFIAEQLLSQTIAFPMCVMLPGCIASLWSVFYFKEIKGRRNIGVLLTAYILTLVGVILIAISK